MQHFRDNEKKQLNMTNSRSFWILFRTAKSLMGYPCVSPYILFYMHGQAITKLLKIQNGH